MNWSRLIYGFIVIIVVVGLIIVIVRDNCNCSILSVAQQDSAGGFLSLSTDPLNPGIEADVCPARIRTVNDEHVTWIIRNPGDNDVDVKLYKVWTRGQPEPNENAPENLIGNVFANRGGRITVSKNCGYGVLVAQLKDDVVREGLAGPRACCEQKAYQYSFMLYLSLTDSSKAEVPYDPELVVEGRP